MSRVSSPQEFKRSEPAERLEYGLRVYHSFIKPGCKHPVNLPRHQAQRIRDLLRGCLPPREGGGRKDGAAETREGLALEDKEAAPPRSKDVPPEVPLTIFDASARSTLVLTLALNLSPPLLLLSSRALSEGQVALIKLAQMSR